MQSITLKILVNLALPILCYHDGVFGIVKILFSLILFRGSDRRCSRKKPKAYNFIKKETAESVFL